MKKLSQLTSLERKFGMTLPTKYNTRPESIDLTLYRRIVGSDDNWDKVDSEATIEEDDDDPDQWNYNFSNLEKTNAAGKTYEFKVEEKEVSGYTAKISGTTITNNLKQQFIVEKVDAEGKALAGASFKLTDEDGKEVQNTSKKADQFRYRGLTAGTYKLVETSAPNGFKQIDKEYEVTVAQNGKITVPGLDVDGTKIQTVQIKNELSNFNLKFNKVDENGDALKGAEFKLTGPDGEVKIEQDADSAAFNAESLQAGKYTLEETNVPDGYKEIDPIKFIITEQGKVEFDNDALISNSKVTLGKDGEDSTLEFTLENVKVGTVKIAGTKVWDDFDNSFRKRPENIELTLQRRLAESDDKWDDVKLEDGKQSLTVTGDATSGNWDYDFGTVQLTNAKEDPYEFRVVETPIASYDHYKDPIYHYIQADGDRMELKDGEGKKPAADQAVAEFDVTNQIDPWDVTIGKYNTAGKLDGMATFTATLADDNWQAITGGNAYKETLTPSDSKGGKYVFNQLVPGNYLIEETATNDDHVVNGKQYRLSLSEKGEITIENADSAVQVNTNQKDTVDFKNWDPEITKTADRKSVAVGDEFNWHISMQVPQGIETFKSFTVSDEIDSRLDYVGVKDVQLKIQDVHGKTTTQALKNDDTYKTVVKNNQVTVVLLNDEFEGGRDALESAVKKAGTQGTVTLEFKLTTVINKTFESGTIENTAVLNYMDGQNVAGEAQSEDSVEGKPVKIATGGANFKKVIANTNNPLAGAKFKVYRKHNGKTQYLSYRTDSQGRVTDVKWTSKQKATTLTSPRSGIFKVSGLAYGTYFLEETKAPDGYRRLTKDVAFKVNATSASKSQVTYVENSKNPQLPITGTMGMMLMLLAGIILIVAGYVLYRRRRLS